MKIKSSLLVMIALILCFCTSCHSAIAYGFGGDTPYAGTQLLFMSSDPQECDAKDSQEWTMWDRSAAFLLKTVDLPLCLIADTILYPVMLLDRSVLEPKEPKSYHKR